MDTVIHAALEALLTLSLLTGAVTLAYLAMEFATWAHRAYTRKP